MATKGLPRLGWQLQGVCPTCDRATALTLAFAGGRMPLSGAVQLEAHCDECGGHWQLARRGRRGHAHARRGRSGRERF